MKLEKFNRRRNFIKKTGLALASLTITPGLSLGSEGINLILQQGPDSQSNNPEGLKTVAFICNIYFSISHADSIGTKLFLGSPMDQGRGIVPPKIKIVSMYIAQIGSNDIGVQMAKKNGVTLYPTIADALTLGGDKLAVDAVVYIGEHGDYPNNRFGEKMYPRMNTLEQIFRVFDASNKSVPVYSDKALSYSWLDSKWIFDRAKELNVPMMTGSSLTYTSRDPYLVHPLGTKITESVAIGPSTLDSYGFHVTEILQLMHERRTGGETGVASVQTLKGNEVWAAMDSGEISWKLVQAAYDRISFKLPGSIRELVKMPYAVKVNYIDGTKGVILMLNGIQELTRPDGLNNRSGWAYAAHADGKIISTEFVLDASVGRYHTSYLCYNIERFILTGKPPAPFERSLFTSSIIDMGIRSLNEGGKLKKTPFLEMKYSAEGYEPYIPTSPWPPTEQSTGIWPPKGYEFINKK
jgi:hypothetical protein